MPVVTTTGVTGRAGETVMVALRPEMIAIGDAGAPAGHNRLPATVTDVAFLGSVVRISTSVGDGARVDVDTFNNPNLAVPERGRQVELTFPPEAALVLAQGSVVQEEDALAAAEALL